MTAFDAWTFEGAGGRDLRTPHYRLRTTVSDTAVTDGMLRLLEAAYPQYAALLPSTSVGDARLDVFLFARPEEWETFTRRLTGPDAPVYLSVGQGGYAYGDTIVCWLANPDDLPTVVAHEGFHQYVARHSARRLPPAVEEGLATTFENVSTGGNAVVFRRSSNPRREQGLRDATRAKLLLPLDTLVRLNAGDIAARPLAVREGFYGQCWLFAEMLAFDPSYAGRFNDLITRLQTGRLAETIDVAGAGRMYRPGGVRPMLTDGLGVSWDELDRDYRRRLAAFANDGRAE